MLNVGTLTYLMITDNTLILHLEITAYTAYTGYKGKIEKDMFFEEYIHLIQPIYMTVQIGTHQRVCLQLIFYIVHLSLSTYEFSTLYITLPHNLIKDKLVDLTERIFQMIGMLFFTSGAVEIRIYGLVRKCEKLSPFSRKYLY